MPRAQWWSDAIDMQMTGSSREVRGAKEYHCVTRTISGDAGESQDAHKRPWIGETHSMWRFPLLFIGTNTHFTHAHATAISPKFASAVVREPLLQRRLRQLDEI